MGIITSMLYICACEYMIRVVDFPVKLVDRSIDRSIDLAAYLKKFKHLNFNKIIKCFVFSILVIIQ